MTLEVAHLRQTTTPNDTRGGPPTTNHHPNIWENPTVTGLNRLQPHSRNVRPMSIAYEKHLQIKASDGEAENNEVSINSNPCICLDSSSLEQTTFVTSSKGWQFRLFPNPNCIPLNYILPCTNLTDEELKMCEQFTRVPSNWTLTPSHKYKPTTTSTEEYNCCCNMHDPPRYTNVQMPFHTLYPHVPKDDNPTGLYRLEFSLSDGREVWLGNSNSTRRVILHLGGVESCHFIYLNGNFVGMSKDSKLSSEYDITSMIHCNNNDSDDNTRTCTSTNENTLVIIASKWSDASFLEQQDHWRGMGGIHRSIFVYSTFEEAFVEDIFCKANLLQAVSGAATDDDCDGGEDFPSRWKGRIDVQARIGRRWNERLEARNIYYNEEFPYTISKQQQDGDNDVVVEYNMLFQLYDPDNAPVFNEALDVTATEDNPLMKDVHRRFNLLSFSADVPGNVQPWSDESPSLYRLEATLVQQERVTIQHQRMQWRSTPLNARLASLPLKFATDNY